MEELQAKEEHVKEKNEGIGSAASESNRKIMYGSYWSSRKPRRSYAEACSGPIQEASRVRSPENDSTPPPLGEGEVIPPGVNGQEKEEKTKEEMALGSMSSDTHLPTQSQQQISGYPNVSGTEGRHHFRRHHQDDTSLRHNLSSGGCGESSNATLSPLVAEDMFLDVGSAPFVDRSVKQKLQETSKQSKNVYKLLNKLTREEVEQPESFLVVQSIHNAIVGTNSVLNSLLDINVQLNSKWTTLEEIAEEERNILELACERGHLDTLLLKLPRFPANFSDLLKELMTKMETAETCSVDFNNLKNDKAKSEKASISVVVATLEVRSVVEKIKKEFVTAGLLPTTSPPFNSIFGPRDHYSHFLGPNN